MIREDFFPWRNLKNDGRLFWTQGFDSREETEIIVQRLGLYFIGQPESDLIHQSD